MHTSLPSLVGINHLDSFAQFFIQQLFQSSFGLHWTLQIWLCQVNSGRTFVSSRFVKQITYMHQSLQEEYAREFSVFKPDKRLKWLPHLGTVQLEIQLEDRLVTADVPPLEAAIIELFSDGDDADTDEEQSEGTINKTTWAFDDLLEAVGSVSKSALIKALATWIELGVLKEDPENVFVLLDRKEEIAHNGVGVRAGPLYPFLEFSF